MDGNPPNNATAKIAMGLDAVFAAAPARRGEIFAGVHRALGLWLETMECANPRSEAEMEFCRKTRIYLRALKTYPAASEEWLEVFWSFRQLYDRWTLGPAAQPATSAARELERLRRNPHLVMKDNDMQP